MATILIGLILFVVGLMMLRWSGVLTQSKKPDYKAIVDQVSAESLQRKSAFMDEFIPLMKSEFPHAETEITPMSMDDFYGFSGNWVCAHHPESYAQGARAKTIGNEGFKRELQSRLLDLLPKGLAEHAQQDFPGWLDRMDKVIKVSVERSWSLRD